MIVLFDINEIWRRKPFAALAEKVPVLGVAPADWMVAAKREPLNESGALSVLPIILPPGWAGKTSLLGMRIVRNRVQNYCEKAGLEWSGSIFTSPHYLPLMRQLPEHMTKIYYASDDYSSYDGWGRIGEMEEEMVKLADHSFFVSEELRARACTTYDVNSDTLSVSMNATEKRFFGSDTSGTPLPVLKDLPRPIAGVIGGINERLDFKLLLKCAELPELGCLLLVGELPEDPSPDLQQLLTHPSCIAVGKQPHDLIHRWFHELDVGLIPYVDSKLNRYCSPMRLFDHLASGAAVVSSGACSQVDQVGGENVRSTASPDEFVQAVSEALEMPKVNRQCLGITWSERADGILNVLEGLQHV